MAYCTVTEVQAYFRNLDLVAVSGKGLTEAKIDKYIELNSAQIDARLGKRYVTPITGTEALKVVARICVYLSVADVEDAIRQAAGEKDAFDRARDYRKMAYLELDYIETGKVDLSDASKVSTSTFVNSNVKNSVCPVFKKGCRQW